MRRTHLLPTLRLPQIVFLLALLAGIFIAAVPIHRYVHGVFLDAKDAALTRLEEAINRPLSYERVSPAIFRGIEIGGLTVHGKGGEPPVLIEIRRVRVGYRILELVRGNSGSALESVDLRGAELTIVSGRDEDAVQFISDLLVAGDRGFPSELTVSGRNVSVTYADGGDRYRLTEADFTLQATADGVRLSAGARAAVESSLIPGRLGRVETEILVDGMVGERFQDGTATVSLVGSQSWLFRAPEQTFRLDLSPESILVRKVRDRAPLDVSAQYNRQQGILEARFEAAGFVPATAVILSGAWSPANAWMDSLVSGSGELTLDVTNGTVSYEGRVTAEPDHPTLPEGLEATVELEGSGERAVVKEARVSGGGGTGVFSGVLAFAPFGLEGTLSLRGLSYAGYGPVTGNLELASTESGGVSISADTVAYKRATVFDIAAELDLGQEAVSGRVETALSPRGDSRVVIGFRAPVVEDQGFSGQVRLVNVDLGRAYQTVRETGLFPQLPRDADQLTGLRVNARGDLNLGGADYEIRVPFVSLYNEKRPGQSAYAAISATPEEIRVDDLSVSMGGAKVRGSITMESLFGDSYRLQSSFRSGGEEYVVRGVYRSGKSGVLTVNEEVVVRGYALRSGGVLLRASASEFRLGAEERFELGFNLTAVALGLDDWSATVRKLRVEGETDATGPITLAANAKLHPEGGSLDSVRYQDRFSNVSGEGSIRSLDEGYRLTMAVRNENETEQYEVVGRWVNGAANGQVSFSGLSLRRLEIAPVRGTASGELSFQDIPVDPQLSLRLNTSDATFNADSFTASGVLVATPQVVELRNLQLSYLTTRIRNGSGALDLEGGKARFEAVYQDQSVVEGRRIEATASAQFAEKSLPLKAGTLATAPFTGEILLSGVEMAGIESTRWRIGLARSEDALRIAGGPGQSIDGEFRRDGDFRLSLSSPLPIRFNGEGRLKEGRLEATLTEGFLSATQAPGLLDFGDVRIVAGEATGSLRVVGPVNDPDFFGTFRGSNVEGEMNYVPGRLGPTDGFIIFEEKVLTVNPLQVPTVEDGQAELSGSATLTRWGVDEFRFQVVTGEGQSIPINYRSADLTAEGRAMGRLKIQGTPGITNVTGELVVFSTSITLGDPEFAQDMSEGITNVDLSVTTQGRAEFIWPSRDLPVLRAFAERGESVRIVTRSNPEQYSLKGTVDVQGGEIYYFDRSFFIREGRIIFNESEEGFDPRLQARAEVREVASQGPVRIFLVVEEERLSNLTPRLESSPPLSTEEIVSILGQEFLAGAQDGSIDVSSALLLPADVLQMAVLSRVESGVRDFLGLDLLSVRSQVLGNVVAGAGSGQEPLDSPQASFGQYLNNTTLFLGKYVGSDLFLEMLFEAGQTAPNEEALINAGDVGFGAEVGIEWQTPFFLLNWSFAPQTPETLFVTDSRFELSWEYSY